MPICQSDILAHPWSKLDPYIGSPQSLESIGSWISACKAEDHKYCRPPSDARSYFPSRAIDVQSACSGIVYLRDRNEVISRYGSGEDRFCHDGIPHAQVYPEYWTLSHRWGSRVTQLRRETEHQLRGGISLESISPTFRDAALVVHRLGYKYLWIDSLSIFQDSETDWQREANTMVDIYRHSFCNISAISPSADPAVDPSLCGLFRHRRDDMRLLFPFITNVGVRTSVSLVQLIRGPWMAWNDSIWLHEIESAPLHSRGWVVQERFLSTRTIYFTQNQIYWECLESTSCEAHLSLTTSKSVVRRGSEVSKLGFKAARLVIAQAQAGQPHKDRLRLQTLTFTWFNILSTYVSCALTKDSDRLIAMSGVAKAFREANGDTYLAGLWKHTIHYGLLWKTKATSGTLIQSNESYAPSWSWASVTTTGTGASVELCVPTHRATTFKPLIRLIDERIIPEPPDGDTTGFLRSAELDIECVLSYFQLVRKFGSLNVYTAEAKTQFYDKFTPLECNVFMDTSDQAENFTRADVIEGICIPICRVNGFEMVGFYALIVESAADSVFKRTGVLQCVLNEWRRIPTQGTWWNDWDTNNLAGLSHITLI